MNLFNLIAKLSLDKKAYDKGLDDAKKETSSFASKLSTNFKKAGKAIGAVATTIGTVAGSVVAFGKKMIDLGGEIDDNAQRLGLSTEEYQLWAFAMTKAGTEVTTLQRGMIQLTTFTENLSKGQADALKTLDDLGIGYEEFTQADNGEKLKLIINALQGMSDQTEKARLASELFGDRVGQQLMPLLNEEQGSLDKLNDTLKEQGIIVGEENIQASAQLGDAIDLLKAKFTSLALNLATQVFPEIQNLIEGFSDLATGGEDASQKIADSLTSIIDKVGDKLPELINRVWDIVGALFDSFGDQEFLNKLFDNVLKLAINLINGLTNNVDRLVTFIFNLASAIIEAVANNIGDLVGALLELVAQLVLRLSDPENLAKILESVAVLIVKIFEFIALDLPKKIGELSVAIYDGIKDLFSAKRLQEVFKLSENFGITIVNGIGAGLNKLSELIIPGLTIGKWKVWDDIKVKLFNIPSFKLNKYAKGGMMINEIADFGSGIGTLYEAGEDGAEIVAQGRNGTGVANIVQIADAQLMALQDYGLNETIRESAAAIVNGIVSGLTISKNGEKSPEIYVQLGDREFKSYVVKVINDTLNAQGRKDLSTVTAYV